MQQHRRLRAVLRPQQVHERGLAADEHVSVQPRQCVRSPAKTSSKQQAYCGRHRAPMKLSVAGHGKSR
jgi:hypothetical protein